jgi:hypothetical protein
MIPDYRWVHWGPLGVLHRHENEKNRKNLYKLTIKAISQGTWKQANELWVCPMQDGT